jgi:phage tail-like protein
MAGGRNDPYLGFNFAVEIDSMVVGGFSEVSGMEADTEVQEFREGGLNEYMHKRAGPIKYPGNLVLKRGISDAAGLWSWYAEVLQGNIQRKTVSIILLDSACQEQRRWSFQRAYPVKWTGPNFRAVSSEVAVESVELAHEGLLPGAPSQSQQMGFGVEFSVQVSASIDVSADVSISASLSI